MKLERELVSGADDVRPGTHVGTASVSEEGVLEIEVGGHLLYRAALEHWAWSMIFTQGWQESDYERRPPEGTEVVTIIQHDGRKSVELRPLS